MKWLIKGILVMVLIALPAHDCYGEMRSIRSLAGHANQNALPEWNQTYEAYGRTVQVDIPVIIPDVDRFPIIQVCVQMGNEVASKIGLKKSDSQENAGDGIFYEDPDVLSLLDSHSSSEERATVFCGNPKDSAFLGVSNRDPISQRSGNWGFTREYYYPYEITAEAVFAEDNRFSLADAEDALKRLLNHYYGDADIEMDYIEVYGRARKQVGSRWDDLGDYKEDYPKGTYVLHYRQQMQGIPVWMAIGSKMLTTGEANFTPGVEAKAWRIGGMSDTNKMEFMDYASFSLNAILIKEEKILEDDVPLASLDEVIGRLEEEIKEGRLRDVYALRLGYVCYLDEGSPETYTLYPAWMCDCIYAESAKENIMESDWSDAFRENVRYEQIIIDAQTCELQAGWIAEDEGFFHAAPITWDGV